VPVGGGKALEIGDCFNIPHYDAGSHVRIQHIDFSKSISNVATHRLSRIADLSLVHQVA
jgi:hypothetical protein